MFDALLEDLERGCGSPCISARFHNGLIKTFVRLAELLRARESLNRVCLSGGSFHNAYLLEQLQECLKCAGFEVYSHSEVPAGDGGLSLGQALVAAHQARENT